MKEGLCVHKSFFTTLITNPCSRHNDSSNHFYFFFSPPVKTFNENFNSQRTEADILSIVSKAEEFEQLKVRGHHL